MWGLGFHIHTRKFFEHFSLNAVFWCILLYIFNVHRHTSFYTRTYSTGSGGNWEVEPRTMHGLAFVYGRLFGRLVVLSIRYVMTSLCVVLPVMAWPEIA